MRTITPSMYVRNHCHLCRRLNEAKASCRLVRVDGTPNIPVHTHMSMIFSFDIHIYIHTYIYMYMYMYMYMYIYICMWADVAASAALYGTDL